MKFIVRDEDNKEFEVEEVKEEIETSATDNEDASLSEEEIGALKKLASVADKLVALLEVEKDEHAEEPEAEMLDEDEDEEVEEEDIEEEVVDTDEEFEEEKLTRKDSKKSVGAIERKKSRDSVQDSQELDVAQAWAKRYGGNK